MVRYKEVSKQDVIAQYTQASRKSQDFQKAKWGSSASMVNRFRLGLSLIDWTNVRRWLDIGCGMGGFFELVQQSEHHLEEMIGVDITPEIVTQARAKEHTGLVSFVQADLENLPPDVGAFDLVTLVGVLQQCGLRPERALPHCVKPLATGGQLFLTTKHLGWNAFASGEKEPQDEHSWFQYDEIIDGLEKCAIDVETSGGFLPGEGKRVAIEQGHTMYVLGRKSPR